MNGYDSNTVVEQNETEIVNENNVVEKIETSEKKISNDKRSSLVLSIISLLFIAFPYYILLRDIDTIGMKRGPYDLFGPITSTCMTFVFVIPFSVALTVAANRLNKDNILVIFSVIFNLIGIVFVMLCLFGVFVDVNFIMI